MSVTFLYTTLSAFKVVLKVHFTLNAYHIEAIQMIWSYL